MPEPSELMTPAQFESMLTNPANNVPDTPAPTEEASEPTETEEAAEEKVADDVAVGDQEEKPPVEEKAETEDKPAEEKKEDEEEKLYDVKVDGEDQKVTLKEALKRYEHMGASTKRFMAASELKKEAEAIKARAEQVEQKARGVFNNLLTNPDALLQTFTTHAPEVFRLAFEKYAQQQVADQELYEKDPMLYQSTIAHRKQQEEIKQQRQALEQQKREIEEEKERRKKESETSALRKTREVYEGAVPVALKAAGVPADMVDSRVIKSALKELVTSNWSEDLTNEALPQLVKDCAKELVKDPFIKSQLGNGKQKKETETESKPENKRGVTVTNPTQSRKKPEWIKPNDFLKIITGR